MIVSCPSCSTQYRLDATRLKDGRGKLRCARCKTVFPVAAEGAASAAPAEAARAAALRPQPPRAASRLDVALLACEAGALRQRLQGLLHRLGPRVIASDSGPAALDIARRSKPRLVVATSWLPDLTGRELVAALRDEPTLAATRSLLLGSPARAHRWRLDEASMSGADAYLPDDAREQDLEPVLRSLLALGDAPLALPEDEIRAHARVVVDDMRLYYAAELEEGRRTGTTHPRLTEYLTAARAGCAERFPAAGSLRPALGAWDDEVRRALRR